MVSAMRCIGVRASGQKRLKGMGICGLPLQLKKVLMIEILGILERGAKCVCLCRLKVQLSNQESFVKIFLE